MHINLSYGLRKTALLFLIVSGLVLASSIFLQDRVMAHNRRHPRPTPTPTPDPTPSPEPLPGPTSKSVDSAGYQTFAAPGELMSAFGTGFPANSRITEQSASTPLPNVLEGVSVLVNGVPAPLAAVVVWGPGGKFQINYQLPYSATNPSTVEVFYMGTRITSETLAISDGGPGLFTVDCRGKGQIIAENFDSSTNTYTPNNADTPVEQGAILVLYGTGAGLTLNQNTGLPENPGDGHVAPMAPLYITPTTPTVTIGGQAATVLFSGLAPGYAGLWQITIRVPLDTPTGSSIPVVVNYTGKTTQADATVAVTEAGSSN